jgi:hypothetical protein
MRIALAALATVAAWPFLWLLDGTRSRVEILGAVAVAVALSRWTRPPRAASTAALAGLATSAAYQVAIASRVGLPGPGSVGEVWASVTGSGTALLAGPWAAAPPAAPAAVPALLAFTAAFTSIELAARVGRRATAVRLAPALGLHAVALLLCGPGAPGTPLPAIAMAAATIVALVPAWRGRAVPLAAIPVVGGVTALAVVAALVVPGREASRVDAHAAYRPPPEPITDVTPLGEVAGRLSGDDEVLFRVRLTQPDPPVTPVRFPIAVLDRYDGTTWGLAADHTFVPVVPGGTQGGAEVAPDRRIEQTYTLAEGYGSAFVPHVGHPVEVRSDAVALRWDARSGMVRHEAATAPAGALRYTVVSDRAGDASIDRVGELTHLPDPPVELIQFADEHPGTDPLARIEAMAASLRSERFGYDPGAPAGHAYPRLAAFVRPTAPASALRRAGTSEQPAALLAVLARLLGLPSRVVVGYDAGPDASAPPRAGDVEVRAHQIHAWVQVHAPGRGWIDVDPTDRRVRMPVDRPTEATSSTTAEPRRAPMVPARPEGGAGDGGGGGDPAGAPPDEPAGSCPAGAPDCLGADADRGPLVVMFVAAGVALAPCTPLLARQVRRRRRRRRATPLGRVLGAWDETTDRLRAHGLAVGPAATPASLAEACRTPLGEGVAASLQAWRPVFDAALYAPAEPGVHLAGQAWAAEAASAAAIGRVTRRRARVRAALDPRPLLPVRLRRPTPSPSRWRMTSAGLSPER